MVFFRLFAYVFLSVSVGLLLFTVLYELRSIKNIIFSLFSVSNQAAGHIFIMAHVTCDSNYLELNDTLQLISLHNTYRRQHKVTAIFYYRFKNKCFS